MTNFPEKKFKSLSKAVIAPDVPWYGPSSMKPRVIGKRIVKQPGRSLKGD
jgi:hypothetical protein